jgi:hypothetical protein
VKRTIALAGLLLASGSVFARADCPKYPKNEWMAPADARKKIEAMGYKIDKFKVSGDCYEIYGFNKEGKKAEVYFDAKNLAIVKSEIGK